MVLKTRITSQNDYLFIVLTPFIKLGRISLNVVESTLTRTLGMEGSSVILLLYILRQKIAVGKYGVKMGLEMGRI